jgi:Calcineurin-like phosphoesterase
MSRAARGFLLSGLAAGAVWVAAPAAAPMPARAPAGRVVAVGDIHGDLDAFVGILQRAGLIDDARRWSGQTATLVQVGDMIDRGPQSRAVMDFLMALQKDAHRQGGRVVVLLGNHEAMNIYGDLRYVTAADYASYADDHSQSRLTAAYEAAARLAGAGPMAPRDDWMSAHPPGFVEQREAFGPDGEYGRWLRSLPVVAKVNDSLFVHGGIGPDFASWSVGRINDAVAGEIRAYDADKAFLVDRRLALPWYGPSDLVAAAKLAWDRQLDGARDLLSFDNWVSARDDGPLWFRGYAEWPDAQAEPLVAQVLAKFDVARVVVGHTTEPGRVVSRFDGKAYLIDTGMLRGYITGGRASALEIDGASVRTIYENDTRTPD